MADGAFFPHGTTVTFGGVEIGGLLDVPIPSLTKGEVETTAHGDWTRTFVPGIGDAGTMSLSMRMIPEDAGQLALVANSEADAEVEEVVITLPPHVTPQRQWVFDAYVQTMGGNLPWDNAAAERTAELRVVTAPAESDVES